MSRFWQDAVNIFEAAAAAADGGSAHFAILVDARNGLRIVDSAGWNVDALRSQYRAEAAYCVVRTPTSVTVEAQNGSESCTLKKSAPANRLTNLGGSIPYHLIRANQRLVAGHVAPGHSLLPRMFMQLD